MAKQPLLLFNSSNTFKSLINKIIIFLEVTNDFVSEIISSIKDKEKYNFW